MAIADNELDIDDYYKLSVKDQTELDDWLRGIGGFPNKTRKLTLKDGICLAEEYLLDDHDRLTWDKRTRDVETMFRELRYKQEPSVWKKIDDKE
jgi:hypothetical protein